MFDKFIFILASIVTIAVLAFTGFTYLRFLFISKIVIFVALAFTIYGIIKFITRTKKEK